MAAQAPDRASRGRTGRARCSWAAAAAKYGSASISAEESRRRHARSLPTRPPHRTRRRGAARAKVEQHVARAGVETAHRRTGCEQVGQVRDAAEVQRRRVRDRHARTARVKRGHQRRALPARGDVATPEVGDDRHAEALGDARRIVELERPAGVGTMAHGLPVDAGSHDVLRRNSGGLRRFRDRVRIKVGELDARLRGARELVVAARLQRQQRRRATRRATRRAPRRAFGTRRLLGREIGDDGIDAVETRPRHHAGVDVATHPEAPRSVGGGEARGRKLARECQLLRERLDVQQEGAERLGRHRAGVRQRDRQRIARLVVDAELVVQVRTGRPAGLRRRSRSSRPAARARPVAAAARSATGARTASSTAP